MGIEPLSWEYLGNIGVETEKGNRYIHNVYMVKNFTGVVQTDLEEQGRLSWVSLAEADQICVHPVSKKIISMVREVIV